MTRSVSEELKILIERTVTAMGFDLVAARFTGTGTPTLQIMAERPDGSMTVDDCAELSHAISAALDVEDPIKGEYFLEISSPGIDRPLVRLKDFAAYQGYEAKLELKAPLDGRKRFRGQLVGVDGDRIEIMSGGATFSLNFADIATAKLVLTDALLAAHEARAGATL